MRTRIKMHPKVPIRPLTFCFFTEGFTNHLFNRVPVFLIPLIRLAEKCHPARPQLLSSDRDLRATRGKEHENNEPALGVAELVWNIDMDERTQTRGKLKGRKDGRAVYCARVKWRGLEREEPASTFSQRMSRRPVGVDPCTLDVLRINGEGLVDVETR